MCVFVVLEPWSSCTIVQPVSRAHGAVDTTVVAVAAWAAAALLSPATIRRTTATLCACMKNSSELRRLEWKLTIENHP